MFMHKPRGLNPGESYACTRTAVRKSFEARDLTVLWGASRSFSFDNRIRRKPKIQGTVVASLVINHYTASRLLSFYVITDPAYGARQKEIFEEACLPRMRQWLDRISEQDDGFDELIIERTQGTFRIHELQYV